jgi:hypothetical protein
VSEQIDWEKVRTDLRERAAIAAMQGFCANQGFDDASYKQIAEWSVAHADALLAELKKEETK